MGAFIQNKIDDYNNRPIQELDGLTPFQMHSILYNLFGKNCPIVLKDKISNNAIDKIKIFRLCEEFLKIIQRENVLKLTPLGNLQKKIVKELYDHRFILLDGFECGICKNYIEEEVYTVHNAKLICLLAGLIKKINNTFILTAKGKKMLTPPQRTELLKIVLETFIKKFNWEYNDKYREGMTGQFGIGYVLILLMKFGNNERYTRFYADKYLTAFPKLINNFVENKWLTPMDSFYGSFIVRVFERFLYWFNFVDVIEKKKKFNEIDTVVINEVMNNVFQLKI